MGHLWGTSQDGPPRTRDNSWPDDTDFGIGAQQYSAGRIRMTLTKRDQVPGVVGTHAVGRFDFHGQQLPVLFEDEVDLLSGTEPPVVEIAGGRTVPPDKQVARDEGLKVKAGRRGFA